MKIFFGAQGSILRIFHDLDLFLRRDGMVTDSCYWISDSEFFYSQKDKLELFSQGKVSYLGEWDYTKNFNEKEFDVIELEKLEKKYGDPFLWNAIVADRRLMYGPLSKLRQTYKNRFGHDELCSILYFSLQAIDAQVQSFQPDCVLTFVPVTYGDYLLYLVAKARNIPFLHLKSTKIKNYVTLSEDIYENPHHIYNQYHKNVSMRSDYLHEEEAQKYINDALKSSLTYEGDFSSSKRGFVSKLNVLTKILPILFRFLSGKNKIVSSDNHTVSLWQSYVENAFGKKWRKNKSLRAMQKKQISLERFKDEKYVFFPLHSEPEVAISVYGRNYQNQIEAIRRVAQSLPLNWKLIVKEHPKTIAYRSSQYYKKISEIPNVFFADVSLLPVDLIKFSQAVVVISSFVGLQSLIFNKPLLVLGKVPYTVLPDSMVKQVHSFDEFGEDLKNLMKNFKKDDDRIRAFIAACMSESVDINLYSDLLKKKGRVSYQADTEKDQIQKLALYFKKRYQEIVL